MDRCSQQLEVAHSRHGKTLWLLGDMGSRLRPALGPCFAVELVAQAMGEGKAPRSGLADALDHSAKHLREVCRLVLPGSPGQACEESRSCTQQAERQGLSDCSARS